MAALKIALLGASRTQLSELAAALDEALKASGWQALLVMAADVATLPADLASFGLVLLAGLQFPAPSLFLDSRASALEPAQEAADQSIRAALAHGAVAYRVLYGTPDERLAHALHAVQSLLAPAQIRPRQKAGSDGIKNQPWVWMCDKCSDPQCEHKLLTALLAQRDSTGRRPAFSSRASY
ncbi:hypothetical protein [Polaromonas hydrogenivorans]|uniref:Uncharacterized protein n=1 Tax=Polaromonas hydrogenivorans TaxID=335476 RepID=A0AAU7LNI1_9BURK